MCQYKRHRLCGGPGRIGREAWKWGRTGIVHDKIRMSWRIEEREIGKWWVLALSNSQGKNEGLRVGRLQINPEVGLQDIAEGWGLGGRGVECCLRGSAFSWEVGQEIICGKACIL